MSFLHILAIFFALLIVGSSLLWALCRWATRMTSDELDPDQAKYYGRRRTDRIRSPELEQQEAEARARYNFNMECD